MKEPEKEIQEKLWAQVAPELEPVITAVLESRKSKEKKAELLRGALELAYKSGLCRGYDLGFVVFGNGDDSDDSDDDDEPVDVDENGEPT